jgi:hypothetical protein
MEFKQNNIEVLIDICTHEKCNIFLVPDGFIKQCINCKKLIKVINS